MSATLSKAPTRISVVGLVLLLFAVGACRSSNRSSTADPPPNAETSPTNTAAASATPGAPPTYQPANADACRLLDDTDLAKALGEVGSDQTDPHRYDSTLATTVRCNRSYGAIAAPTLVSVEITTINRDTAQPMYDGLRSAQRTNPTLTEVPGFGQGAYTYTDPQTGPRLAMYDGNLHLSIEVIETPGADADATPPMRTLVAPARAIATRLPRD